MHRHNAVLAGDVLSPTAGSGRIGDVVGNVRLSRTVAMIWPYDDRGRMVGEDVWEYDDTDRDFIKLDAADVLTTKQAATLVDQFIQPLPSLPTRSG